jgi:P-type conjugative transfer protein TrbL
MDGIITSTVSEYINVFNSYFAHFFMWGQEFFFAGLVITIVWMCLWHAFDKNSFHESMPEFIKEFFILALFYSFMLYGRDWLSSIPISATKMGTVLSGMKVDPSSIIDQGIRITNLLSVGVNPTGLLDKIYAAFVVGIVNILIMFAFIAVALDLAVTLLMIYFFIAISGFALSFAVFPFTRSIARKTLDIVISNSMKLLALYLLVAAGNGVFKRIVAELATTKNPFDVIGWVAAAAFLFWAICKSIPFQVARVFSEAVQEIRGTSAAALATSAIYYAKTAAPALGLAAGGAAGLAKITGSTLKNSGAHFKDARSQGLSRSQSLGYAAGGTAKHALSSIGGSVSDHFKHLTSKLSGGPGVAKSVKDIPSYAQRMHGHASAISASLGKTKSGDAASVDGSKSDGLGLSNAGAPSSAGRKAAAPSSTRNTPKPRKSKPKK